MAEGWTALMQVRFQQLRREMTEDISKQIKASEDRLRRDLTEEIIAAIERIEHRLDDLNDRRDDEASTVSLSRRP